MLIVYCETCGRRITDSEVSSGQARKLDENEYICAKCAAAAPPPAATNSNATPSVAPPSSPKNRVPETKQPASGKQPVPMLRATPSGSRVPLAGTATLAAPEGEETAPHSRMKGARSTSRAAPPPATKSNATLLYAGGAVAALIAIAAVVMMSGGKPPAPEASKKTAVAPPTPTPAAQPTPAANPPPTASRPDLPKSMQPANPATEPGKAPEDDMQQIRNEVAAGRLKDARDYLQKNPADPWTYSDMLDGIVTSYRSTPAGNEAKELLGKLKLPEKRPQAPAPPPSAEAAVADGPLEGTGPWTPLFDGKSMDFVGPQSRKFWQIDNGALIRVPGSDDAGQSSQVLENVEVRVKFSVEDAEFMSIRIYQGESGGVSAAFDRSMLGTLGTQPHELILAGRAGTGKGQAILDGKPMACNVEGKPVSGHMQFRCKNGNFRIMQVDMRKLAPPAPPAPAAPATARAAADSDTLPAEDAWKPAVNLLALIDPAKDSTAGVWKSASGALSVDRSQRARIEIPYHPPSEYDVRMTFTRTSSDGELALILPRNEKWFTFLIGGDPSFATFDYDGNPMVNPIRLPAQVDNGVKYVCVVQVRQAGAKAWLNGKVICRWKTDYQGLDAFSGWKLKDASMMGVGCNHSIATFEKIELLEVTGKGSKVR